MTRVELKEFLTKHRLTAYELCKEAGVGHAILNRFMNDQSAGISTRTVERLQAAMYRISRRG